MLNLVESAPVAHEGGPFQYEVVLGAGVPGPGSLSPAFPFTSSITLSNFSVPQFPTFKMERKVASVISSSLRSRTQMGLKMWVFADSCPALR